MRLCNADGRTYGWCVRPTSANDRTRAHNAHHTHVAVQCSYSCSVRCARSMLANMDSTHDFADAVQHNTQQANTYLQKRRGGYSWAASGSGCDSDRRTPSLLVLRASSASRCQDAGVVGVVDVVTIERLSACVQQRWQISK